MARNFHLDSGPSIPLPSLTPSQAAHPAIELVVRIRPKSPSSRAKLFPMFSKVSDAVASEEEELFLPGSKMKAGFNPALSPKSWKILWLVSAVNVGFLVISASCAISAYQFRRALRNNDDNALLRLVDFYCEKQTKQFTS